MIYRYALLLLSASPYFLEANSPSQVAEKGIFPPTGTPGKEGTSPTIIETPESDSKENPLNSDDKAKDPSCGKKGNSSKPKTKKDYFPASS